MGSLSEQDEATAEAQYEADLASATMVELIKVNEDAKIRRRYTYTPCNPADRITRANPAPTARITHTFF